MADSPLDMDDELQKRVPDPAGWNTIDRLMVQVNELRRERDGFRQVAENLQAERDRLREELRVGQDLIGSFFLALKPLNLAGIRVQDPGSHVTDLIQERDQARASLRKIVDCFYEFSGPDNDKIDLCSALEEWINAADTLIGYTAEREEARTAYETVDV